MYKSLNDTTISRASEDGFGSFAVDESRGCDFEHPSHATTGHNALPRALFRGLGQPRALILVAVKFIN
ncbi:hypothetical protein QG37_04573 [Candidozyma auris]|nr:hypothetical protein QG37_04573 [[Candida] auris]